MLLRHVACNYPNHNRHTLCAYLYMILLYIYRILTQSVNMQDRLNDKCRFTLDSVCISIPCQQFLSANIILPDTYLFQEMNWNMGSLLQEIECHEYLTYKSSLHEKITHKSRTFTERSCTAVAIRRYFLYNSIPYHTGMIYIITTPNNHH